MKFQVCLDYLEKHAGFIDAVKRVALTEVPGTKPWVIGKAKAPVSDSLRSTRVARPTASPRSVTRRTSGGAYDVSDMARKMGLVDE